MTIYKAARDGSIWVLTILHNPGSEEDIDVTARFGPNDVEGAQAWMFRAIRERGEEPQYSGVTSGPGFGPVLYASTEKGLLDDAMRADVEAGR